VSLPAAQAALMPVYQETLEDVPPPFRKEVSFSMTPLRDRQVRDHQLAARALLGCAAAVLLIACANVGSLLLARSVARRRELAVRAAVGASWRRLAQESLMETTLVGAAGGVAGIGIAIALMRLLRAVNPDALYGAWSSRADWRMFTVALLAALLSGIAAGLAPALERADPEELKRTRTAGGRVRARLALVAGQLALSIALLAGAGLLTRTLWNLQRTPLGFQPESVVMTAVQLPETYSAPAQRSALFERVLERARSIPGTTAAALTDSVPLAGPMSIVISNNMVIEGRPPANPNAGTGGTVGNRTVTPGYFGTMRIPIVRGRGFEEADRNTPESAVVMSETLVRRLFGNDDPTGRRFRPFPEGAEWRRIVGVAADAKNSSLTGKDDPEFYTVWRTGEDRRNRRAFVLIRTAAPSNIAADYLRREIAEIDPTIPVSVSTLEQTVGKQLARPRFQMWLLGSFALLGLALSAIGQFGAIAGMVFNRSGEIGIRMALGSTPGQAARLIASSAARWIAAGSAVGLLLAWWTSRLVASLLYGVKGADAWSFGAALAIAMLVSVAAAWLPARRAARIDPAALLRRE
jgi:predicted permease